MLLLLGARGVVVTTCVRHMCYYYQEPHVCVASECVLHCCRCCCLVEQFIEFTSARIAFYTVRVQRIPSQLVSEVGLRTYQDPHRARRRTVSRCFMTMRSGRVYAMSESGDTAAVTEVVKILLEDRKRREEEAMGCRVTAAAGTPHQGPGGCGST